MFKCCIGDITLAYEHEVAALGQQMLAPGSNMGGMAVPGPFGKGCKQGIEDRDRCPRRGRLDESGDARDLQCKEIVIAPPRLEVDAGGEVETRIGEGRRVIVATVRQVDAVPEELPGAEAGEADGPSACSLKRHLPLASSSDLSASGTEIGLDDAAAAPVRAGDGIAQLGGKLRFEVVCIHRRLMAEGIDAEEVDGRRDARIDAREAAIGRPGTDMGQHFMPGQDDTRFLRPFPERAEEGFIHQGGIGGVKPCT